MAREEDSSIHYDRRLESALIFVCNVLGLKREHFATTALVSLLDEELDRIKYNHDNSSLTQEDLKNLKRHRKTVKGVKSLINAIMW